MKRLRLREYVPPGGHYHVARVIRRGGGDPGLHTHDFSELFFIDAGHCIHLINDQRVELTAGDVVLTRPDDCHGFRAPRGGEFVMVNVAFHQRVIDHLQQRYFANRSNWPGAGATLPATWRIDEHDRHRLNRLTQPLSLRQQELIHLDCFLLNVLQMVTATREVPGNIAPSWLHEAIAAYTAGDDLTGGVTAFADLAGKSPEHVNRTVRRTMGQTSTTLINTIRLNRAAHLLRMTDRPIIHVAHDCGFENVGYFYRCFREQFHTTPRKYRLTAHAIVH